MTRRTNKVVSFDDPIWFSDNELEHWNALRHREMTLYIQMISMEFN